MSGGHFDYKNYVLNDIADAIENYAHKCETKFENEWGYVYSCSEDTIRSLRKTVEEIRRMERTIHKIDYWFSGDIGEEDVFKEEDGP